VANTDGSVLVPLRAALVEALADLPEFADVLCVFAFKVGAKDRKKVWTQDSEVEMSPASMRAAKTFHNEAGSFALIFRVEGIALAPEETSTQAHELMAAAHNFVATHANWQDDALGGIHLTSLTIDGRGYVVEAFNETGSVSEGRLPIRYSARIE
jgi:hypothetical protein